MIELLDRWRERSRTSFHAHAWADAADELEKALTPNIPDDTFLLEPREMFDKALIGIVHRGGETCALYSRAKCIELLAADDGDYEGAVEHYEFNVSGSIGWGFPMFLIDEDDV